MIIDTNEAAKEARLDIPLLAATPLPTETILQEVAIKNRCETRGQSLGVGGQIVLIG